MKTPDVPIDEARRLNALWALRLLDTIPEERFERIVRLAGQLIDAPMAAISLVDTDRQWFKARQGLDVAETSRAVSFCGHTINSLESFEVRDATKDARFADNPLVTGSPGIRFYLGHPLRAPDGSRVGSLCAMDRIPRQVSAEKLALFNDLAAIVEQELASAHIATIDPLTQICNRRGFDMLATQALAMGERHGMKATLHLFDLDAFKQINDRFGHAVGDLALRTFAGILRRVFRGSDVLARLGGDEFAVLQTSKDAECTRAKFRLHDELNAFNARSGLDHRLTVSSGTVTASCTDGADLSRLLAEADRRMYLHKRCNI